MFCKRCGKQIDDHVKFCKYCGQAVGILNRNPAPNYDPNYSQNSVSNNTQNNNQNYAVNYNQNNNQNYNPVSAESDTNTNEKSAKMRGLPEFLVTVVIIIMLVISIFSMDVVALSYDNGAYWGRNIIEFMADYGMDGMPVMIFLFGCIVSLITLIILIISFVNVSKHGPDWEWGKLKIPFILLLIEKILQLEPYFTTREIFEGGMYDASDILTIPKLFTFSLVLSIVGIIYTSKKKKSHRSSYI